jgi:hypothetical protein
MVPIHKNGDKTVSNNYCGISLQLTPYILLNILLSRLSQFIDEIIGNHQSGFGCNSSTTDKIFCIHQILKRKWEYSETVHHRLFIDFKSAYDSMKREVLYNILTEIGIPMKLVWLIKMCLNETYSKFHICKHLFHSFPIRVGLI